MKLKIQAVAIQVLEDTRDYLTQIPQEIYATPQDLLFQASIGQHTRHLIEFFQCLLTQIRQNPPMINYASRQRSPQIEQDPAIALHTVNIIISDLNSLDENITCHLECGEHFAGNTSYAITTSLERELIYNIEHTIHHLAIIKIGIKALAPSMELPGHFGVAPSTVKYKAETCAQ